MKSASSFIRALALCIGVCGATSKQVLAANGSGALTEGGATYSSPLDRSLTIRTVSLLPPFDNTGGIYGQPLAQTLRDLINRSGRWEIAEFDRPALSDTLGELEENPDQVKSLASGIPAEALFAIGVTRGPGGISLRLDLFLINDGMLLAQELVRDHPRGETVEATSLLKEMFQKLTRALPYDGLVLSRQVNRVTLNLGRREGLSENQRISVAQIISVQRHPRFKFVISTEKEIIGQIRIAKVEDTLSFGVVEAEKERGAIQRYSKIVGLRPVNYPADSTLTAAGGGTDLVSRGDSKVAFGEKATEWLPVRHPSFGQVGARLGLGNSSGSQTIAGDQSYEAKSTYHPAIGLDGEMWLNPNWAVRGELFQSVYTAGNPRANSTPSNLNFSLTKYSLAVCYNFLLRGDFFGPKIQTRAGFAGYRLFVDDSSPRTFTTLNYGGMLLGLGISFPVNEERTWYAGGDFNMQLFTNLKEEPVTSGASSNSTVSDFAIYAERLIAENIRLRGALEFSLYSSTLSGDGNRRNSAGQPESVTSISQRHMFLTGGLVYQF